MPDDQADQYGKGYITGTIVGIASTSEKQNAAWRFVEFLTTNTQAVVDFANAIHNVPSTQDALASPDVSQDPNFQTFVQIAQNPNSNTTPASPNGGAYQLTLQDLGYAVESGKETDIEAGLQKAADQIDTDIAQVAMSRLDGLERGGRLGAGPARSGGTGAPTTGDLAEPGVPVAVAARHGAVLHLPAGVDGVLLVHHYNGFGAPTWDGWTTGASCSSTTRSSGRLCATPCGSSWSWSRCGCCSGWPWGCS